MNAITGMKENMLEFSRAYFAEQEASAAGEGSGLAGRTDGGLRAGGLRDGALPGAGLQGGPWESWFSRGIPELASPLAG